METIKYEVTQKGLCSTQCPFCTTSEWRKVGAFECTTKCPAFVSEDKENRTVTCNPEKVDTARFVWSDAMKEKYPDLGKGNEPSRDTRERRTVCFEADTVVEGFYKACEHLAEQIHTVGEKRTKFTTADMTAVRNGVRTDNDRHEVFMYQIKTATGFYQCHQDSLWQMTAAMEQVEGVPSAKRKAFDIKPEDRQDADVILRISFDMDKEVQRIKGCLETDELRQILWHPAIDTATGVMIGSDGHILAAHKLNGYEIDNQSGLPVKFRGLLIVPKQVCGMRGRVTVEAVEGKWEESVEDKDGHTELQEVDGIIVTATDENGRQGVVRAHKCYPNWRGVVPNRIGPAIGIDTKKLAEGVKRVRPQLCDASELMTVQADAGDKAVCLSGEDYDFYTSGSVSVELENKAPCAMKVGLKASSVLKATSFAVKTMHYKGGGYAVVFLGDNTLVLMMPMVNDDYKNTPTPSDGQLRKFDVGEWAERAVAKSQPAGNAKKKAKRGVSKKRAKAAASSEKPHASNELSLASNELSLAERLRQALLNLKTA